MFFQGDPLSREPTSPSNTPRNPATWDKIWHAQGLWVRGCFLLTFAYIDAYVLLSSHLRVEVVTFLEWSRATGVQQVAQSLTVTFPTTVKPVSTASVMVDILALRVWLSTQWHK